jgi:hypothetical protein
MEEQEMLFIKGFNNGYMLKKYEPNLLHIIVDNLRPTNDYLAGFFAGKEEFELENSHKELDELRVLRKGSRDKENDLDKDV